MLLIVLGECWSPAAPKVAPPANGPVEEPFLRCEKCGYGFVGTAANGRGGAYRYYTCFSRQRHGAARCDQRRIPADRIEEMTIEHLLTDLDDGSMFEEAARLGRKEWEESYSGRLKELGRLERKIEKARLSLDKYLKAFESGRLPEDTCFYRVKDLEKELAVLEANRSTLEAEDEPLPVTKDMLQDLKASIWRAVREGTPQDLKGLLSVLVSRVLVDVGWRVQPFYVIPDFSSTGVRIMNRSRRRTPRHEKNSLAGPMLGI